MDAGQFGEHARAHSGMGCGVAAEGQADVIAEWLSSHIQFAPDRLAVIDVFVTETIQRYQPEGGFVDGVAPAVDKDVLPIHYRVGSVRAHDGPEPGWQSGWDGTGPTVRRPCRTGRLRMLSLIMDNGLAAMLQMRRRRKGPRRGSRPSTARSCCTAT